MSDMTSSPRNDNCWAKFSNDLIHSSIRMIRAKNYETVFKFVKVKPRILVAFLYCRTRCLCMTLYLFVYLLTVLNKNIVHP